jgi:aerobic-type carbon monoxide dehydrogenase small subunit (CoxS/CutS family)
VAELVTLKVNDVPVSVAAGSMVAAAVLTAGVTAFRRSVSGEARGPLCGMGICFECRVQVDGVAHVRSCQTLCENGMDVRTDE